MKKKITTRIFSIVLSALMLTPLISFSTLADEESNAAYTVNIQCCERGSVTLTDSDGNALSSQNKPYEKGETVNLLVSPDEQYELKAFSVKCSDETPVETQTPESNKNLRTFTMPEGDVLVNAEFKAIEQSSVSSSVKSEVGYGNGSIKENSDKTFTVEPSKGGRIWRVVGYDKWFESYSSQKNEAGHYFFTDENIVLVRAFFVTEDEYTQLLAAVDNDENSLCKLYSNPKWFFKYGADKLSEEAFNDVYAEYIKGQKEKQESEGVEYKKPVKATNTSKSERPLLMASPLGRIPSVGEAMQGGKAHGDPAINQGRMSEDHSYFIHFDTGFLAGDSAWLICQEPTKPYPIYYGNYTAVVSNVDTTKQQFTIYIYFTADPALNPSADPYYVSESQDCAGYMTFSYVIPSGTLKLKKSSVNDALTGGNVSYSLKGAEYGVFSNSTCTSKVAILITGEDGTSNTVTLNPGYYYVKEITPSKGYTVNKTPTEVYVASGALTTLTEGAAVETPVVIGISLAKESAQPTITDGNSNYSLENAKFGVYKSLSDAQNNVNVLYTMTTNAAGKATKNMIPIANNNESTYYIKEIQAPTGYKTNSDVKEVKYDGLTSYQVTFKETPVTMNIELKKSSSNTSITNDNISYSLGNAKFSVYKSLSDAQNNLNVLYTMTTDAEGKASLSSLPIPNNTNKTYYIKETQAPAGFTLCPDIKEVTYNESTTTYSVEFLETPVVIGISLIKESTDPSITDGNPSYSLENAKFGVYDSLTNAQKGQNALYTMTTNAEGKASLSSLPIPNNSSKTYYIKETQAPVGFALCPDIKEVIYNGDTSYSVTFKEEPGYISISLSKESANPAITNGNPCYSLEGAIFGVYNSSEDARNEENLLYSMTTNTAGEAHLNQIQIPNNSNTTYYIKEIQAPKGYKISTDVKSVKYDGSTSYSVTFAEEPGEDPATIEIKKQSMDPNATQFPLAGVLFKIKYYTNTDKDVFGPANRTWIIQTKLDSSTGVYRTVLHPDYLVEGWIGDSDNGGTKATDATTTLYYNAMGIATIPIGTIKVEEIQPADGYTLEGAVMYNEDGSYSVVEAPYVGVITMDENEAHLSYGNIYTDLNTPISIKTKATAVNGSQMANANQDAVITDTVTCYGIEAEKRMEDGTWVNIQYRLKGEVRNTVNDEVLATTTKDFTTDSFNNHQETVVFNVPAEKMVSGSTFYITERLYTVNGATETLVASEIDKTEVDQQIYVPSVDTVLGGSHGEKVIEAAEHIVLKDTISYANVEAGKEYTVNGILMDKATNNPVRDDEGNEVVASQTVTPAAKDGTVDIIYQFKGASLTGKSLVSFITLKYNDGVIAEHKDITDAAQTVLIMEPSIDTVLYETRNTNGTHMSKNAYSSTVIQLTDEIYFENFTPNANYIIETRLVDKKTGETFIDVTGSEVTTVTEWIPETSRGTTRIQMEFAGYADTVNELVAFETVKYDGTVVVAHEDINDEKQTVSLLPVKISTVLTNTQTNEHLYCSWNNIKLTDTVKYEGLIPGHEYQMKGCLVNGDGNAIKDDNGNDVTKTVTFTPENESGQVAVAFEFAGEKLTESKIVAFEELWDGNLKIAEHKDTGDSSQTVNIVTPSIKTSLKTKDGVKVFPGNTNVVLEDTVTVKHLEDGKDYIIRGILVIRDKDGKEQELLDKSGKHIVAEQKFTCKQIEEDITVKYDFKDVNVEGVDIVAYETVYRIDGDTEKFVVEHKDINDKKQTVYVSKVHTFAIGVDEEKCFNSAKDNVIYDEIVYENLELNSTYEITSSLVEYATGKVITSAVSTLEVLDEDFGDVLVEIPVPANTFTGKAVVFEEIRNVNQNNVVMGKHTDIEDAAQTIYFAKLTSLASGKDGEKTIDLNKDAVIQDILFYKGLMPQKTYLVYTELVNPKNGKVLKFDDKEVKAVTEFTPEKSDGEFVVSMKVSKNAYEGRAVFMQTILDKETKTIVAEGKDLQDKDETIAFRCDHPKTGDTAKPWVWIIIAGAAVLVMVGAAVVIIKKKQK